MGILGASQARETGMEHQSNRVVKSARLYFRPRTFLQVGILLQ